MEGLKVPNQLLLAIKTPKVINTPTRKIAIESLYLSVDRAEHG
ncbi:hypothetical protein [Scytonema sp. UIC 10036]|nr:hypothetical protein [Scytonema sp. UIC 10036]